MKLRSIGLSVVAAVMMASAHADVGVMVQGYVTPAGAEAMACNSFYPVPIECVVEVRGFYPNGFFAYSNADLILAPGACNYAYVTSYFPFVYADAIARCGFNP